MKIKSFFILVFFLLPALFFPISQVYGQIDTIFKGLERLQVGKGTGREGGIDDVKIGKGLKEALRVGTENAVSLTGKKDGYFLNQAIKILMPEKLRNFESALRAVGYGPKIDEFVLSMNRAAEKAAPYAKKIFWDAISEMTFEDAKKILSGHEKAATEYFQNKTSGKLSETFKPIVEKSMNEVGVTRRYKELTSQFESIPFVKKEDFDLDHYVVTKALDGLFYVLGEEEKKIRTDPKARVTDLLKEVFGR